ncbi:serine hydrolase domain-containing protein [Virgibacillus doumboii]|uniref:serine hydrolase domain-containing protein n=1 Tax=Virgibacillus doumboii TaxID=2697503 RepID=UPI0013DEE91F|nr:serine hydrolase [Virgibacillus doumboii]
MKNKANLDSIIEDSSNQAGFSGSVYIKKAEKIIFGQAYGYANRSEKLPNEIHTRFGIASGCKLFTAIGICQLVEKGFITFESRLNECLTIDFPYFDENITIHHLLTHTSGIPDYFDEEVMDDYEELWKDRPVYQMTGVDDFLPLFQSNKMKFHPGERFHYNNAGYIVLGLIIEKQTGIRFTDYIESEIFQQCGMNDSGYFSMDYLPANTALGYIDSKTDGTWKTNIYSIPAKGSADGGAFVTAPDMIKLWDALFNYELLSEKYTKLLLQPHVKVNDLVQYGYGIWMNKKDNGVYKYHLMGYDPGVSFRSSVYPDLDLKVIIPSNKESGPFDVTIAIEDYFGIDK